MYNSLQQDPCIIASKLGGVCNGGIWILDPLPLGTHYIGPYVDDQSPCECNTVYYSLLAACSVCQGRLFLTFSGITSNCTTVYLQQFPKDIPYDTAVPHYAYLDVITNGTFDVTRAQAAGGPESTSPPKATYYPTLTASSTTTGPSAHSNSTTTAKTTNVGAIAGGVVGGVAGLAILAVLIFFLLRHRPAPPPPMAQQTSIYSPHPSSPAPGSPLILTPPLTPGSPILYPTMYPNQVPANYTNSTTTNSIIAGRPFQYVGAPEL